MVHKEDPKSKNKAGKEEDGEQKGKPGKKPEATNKPAQKDKPTKENPTKDKPAKDKPTKDKPSKEEINTKTTKKNGNDQPAKTARKNNNRRRAGSDEDEDDERDGGLDEVEVAMDEVAIERSRQARARAEAAKEREKSNVNKNTHDGEGETEENEGKGNSEPKETQPAEADLRSKRQMRLDKKKASKQVEEVQEQVEQTEEEKEEEAAERYERAQSIKGREPPPEVHLPNMEERRSRLGNDICFENYTLRVPGRTLLVDAKLTLAYGHRYGFVGRNGLGKSTLLQRITQRDGIQIAPHLRVLYVEQEVPGDDMMPIDHVIKADVEREWLLVEEKKLKALEAIDPYWMDNPDEKRCYGLKEVQERMRTIESDKAIPRATAILTGLGFNAQEMKTKPSREYSGGWRMRISLARALFCRPNVLLLDEPTNHLDLHASIWLERYLKKWKSTLVVVSHEATFLNEIVDRIVEIRHKKLTTYKGDYWSYTRTREQIHATDTKQHSNLTKEKQKLIDEKNRSGSSAGLRKRLEEIEEQLMNAEKEDPNVKVSFPSPDPVTFPIVQVQEVTFGYNPGRAIFKKLDFGIDMNSRIALVGLNGVGKSTLMKLMAGEIQPTAGHISLNRQTRTARFSQHSLEQLNAAQTPLEYLYAKFKVDSDTLRGLLGRFGISGDLAARNKIETLSGGQKSRVVLAELAYEQPHVLFLDEPSNHLDLDAIEALAQGLIAYSGGVVLISHNQRLISRVCKEIWVVTTQGGVKRFNGTFEDYKGDIIEKMGFKDEDEEDEGTNETLKKGGDQKKGKKGKK